MTRIINLSLTKLPQAELLSVLIYNYKNKHNKQKINIMIKYSAYFLTYTSKIV